MTDRHAIQVGDLVRLVGTDGYMPPLGSVGVVETAFDEDCDCDVLFPGFPCPNPPGTTWVAHRTWLKRIPPTDALDDRKTDEPIKELA